jgi:hypothetical protein
VPIGIHGNAEIDLGMGLSGNRKDFVATIGDDPADDTNVSQWLRWPIKGGAGRNHRPFGIKICCP